MESLKSKMKVIPDEGGEVFEKTLKFNWSALVGSFKNVMVFLIATLLGCLKLASGAAPFAMAVFGAVNSLRIAFGVSLDATSIGDKFGFGWRVWN